MSETTSTPTPTDEQQDAREACRGDVLCEVPGHVIARDRGNGVLGFEHVAHDAAEGLHLVTAEWDRFALPPRMVCHAPAKSWCHAVYDCDCETYYVTGIEDGRPFHREDGGDGDQHFGRFDPTFCNLKEWFEVDPQEAMHGSLTFPVTAAWNGDGYEFEVVQPPSLAAVSAAAPDQTQTEPHQDARERVARALYEHRQAAELAPQDGYTAWDDLPEEWQDEYREAAEAVLAAVSAAAPDERALGVAADLIDWLADARDEYASAGGPYADAIHQETALARTLAKALRNPEDAWGWLPTWMAPEYEARHAAALAARPAPVVNAAMADAAIEALGMNAYMTPERVAAHHAALGVVWTDPRTVADAPAAEPVPIPDCSAVNERRGVRCERPAGHPGRHESEEYVWPFSAADDEGGQE